MTTESTSAVPKASVLKNLGEVRAMIKRHKLNDYIFSIIGLLALMLALLTLTTLFIDLVVDGYTRFNLNFFTEFPSRRAANAGLLSAWVGSAHVGNIHCRCAYGCGGWLVFRRICTKKLVCRFNRN
jgi:ABC-type phosphate transport system permease subunit